MRWTGNRASVSAGLASVEIGSITLVAPSAFRVVTSAQVEGQCTISSGPPPRADFCVLR